MLHFHLNVILILTMKTIYHHHESRIILKDVFFMEVFFWIIILLNIIPFIVNLTFQHQSCCLVSRVSWSCTSHTHKTQRDMLRSARFYLRKWKKKGESTAETTQRLAGDPTVPLVSHGAFKPRRSEGRRRTDSDHISTIPFPIRHFSKQ